MLLLTLKLVGIKVASRDFVSVKVKYDFDEFM